MMRLTHQNYIDYDPWFRTECLFRLRNNVNHSTNRADKTVHSVFAWTVFDVVNERHTVSWPSAQRLKIRGRKRCACIPAPRHVVGKTPRIVLGVMRRKRRISRKTRNVTPTATRRTDRISYPRIIRSTIQYNNENTLVGGSLEITRSQNFLRFERKSWAGKKKNDIKFHEILILFPQRDKGKLRKRKCKERWIIQKKSVKKNAKTANVKLL